MKHERWEYLLIDYEDGVLDQETSAQVVQHLQECTHCRELQSFGAERLALQQWYQQVPTAFAGSPVMPYVPAQREGLHQHVKGRLASLTLPLLHKVTRGRTMATAVAGALAAILLIVMLWSGDSNRSPGIAVVNAYDKLQSLESLRYTRTVSRLDCVVSDPSVLPPSYPLCVESEREAVGEVVFPDWWHEKPIRPTGPGLTGGYSEFIIIEGHTYVNTGSTWAQRDDIDLQFPLSWLFPADILALLQQGSASIEELAEEEIAGSVTKHYRIQRQDIFEALLIDLWVGKEDELPRKIYQRSEPLFDQSPALARFPISTKGFPVVVHANIWRAETYMFYDFNASIALEPPPFCCGPAIQGSEH
ncbi:MAG: zf-HC2 domain-containing protein [Chloroflexi bacterium]|nr:zf-HC2 domain-containing protein [Chloroflexota bacterium]